ncbi:hypothetical protein Tco_1414635 [Tanacetum coccineum]
MILPMTVRGRKKQKKEWFTKKSRSVDVVKRKIKLLWILFKITFMLINPKTKKKKIKGLIKKDELTIADPEVLEEAQWSDGDNDVSKP